MRRADRLFEIVMLLRRRKVTTAHWLAQSLEVSERTIYRDIQDLMACGVPIDGEAGIGYRVAKGFDLPPLMFDDAQIEALVLGARMVMAWGDDALKEAARGALAKAAAALPAQRQHLVDATPLFALSFVVSDAAKASMLPLRQSIAVCQFVRFAYEDRQAQATQRTVAPLGLYFWGAAWTLAAYCEMRQGFRNFRLDRIREIEQLPQTFELKTPYTLRDFVRAMESSNASSTDT